MAPVMARSRSLCAGRERGGESTSKEVQVNSNTVLLQGRIDGARDGQAKVTVVREATSNTVSVDTCVLSQQRGLNPASNVVRVNKQRAVSVTSRNVAKCDN
jgi:hypothetical protein